MKVVYDESVDLENMGEFWFCGIKYFHEGFLFRLNPPIPHSTWTLNGKP
jgi:hypothetical protein